MLEVNTVIRTTNGKSLKIIKYLGGGGQGDVYKCDYNGEIKVLKWYKNLGKNPKQFRKNLIKNCDMGSPDPMFLWPLAVTEVKDGTFGYVMDLVDLANYHEVSEYVLANVKFSSYVAATEACIRIVNAFRILHRKGFSYKDLNDGNFFINPLNGSVLIGDNDNVSPNGEDIGILGKPRYMAPELVRGDKTSDGKFVVPNTLTDCFSLAVILFLVICGSHPLEGKAWASIPCMTQKNATILYGNHPVFIFDPVEKSNEATKITSPNAIRIWKYLPKYIQELFLRVFSSETMIKTPAKRPTETDWLKALCRFRASILKCGCGNEIFYNDPRNIVCDGCGRKYTNPMIMKFPDYEVAVVRGMKIYRTQIVPNSNINEAVLPAFRVLAKKDDPNALFLDNISTQEIVVLGPNNFKRVLKENEKIQIVRGLSIKIFGGTVDVL